VEDLRKEQLSRKKREEEDRAQQAEEREKQEQERVQQEQERVQQERERALQAQERIKKEHAKTEKECEEIIKWFEGHERVDYHTKHQTVVDQRQEGTGMWIYNDESFKALMASSRGLLWIRGIRTFSSHIARSGLLSTPTRSG